MRSVYGVSDVQKAPIKLRSRSPKTTERAGNILEWEGPGKKQS